MTGKVGDLTDRIEELEKWKAEASKALTHWDHVAQPVVKGNAKYLGWYKWDAVAVELNRQDARIEELEAALREIEASEADDPYDGGAATMRDIARRALA